jgi:multisubunit Na+/H+ antiporter MnhB subunit
MMDSATVLLALLAVSGTMTAVSIAVLTIALKLSKNPVKRISNRGRKAFILGLLAALFFIINVSVLTGSAVFLDTTSSQNTIYLTYFLLSSGCVFVVGALILMGSSVFRIVLRIDDAEDGD